MKIAAPDKLIAESLFQADENGVTRDLDEVIVEGSFCSVGWLANQVCKIPKVKLEGFGDLDEVAEEMYAKRPKSFSASSCHDEDEEFDSSIITDKLCTKLRVSPLDIDNLMAKNDELKTSEERINYLKEWLMKFGHKLVNKRTPVKVY